MSFALWPPPLPTLPVQPLGTGGTYPADGRFPDNVEDPRDTLFLGLFGDVNVWGHTGTAPDPTLTSWIERALDFTPQEDAAWGTYLGVFSWQTWLGRGQYHGLQPPYISIEIRTPAEVAAASGDSGLFAYTTTSDEIGLPDGLTSDGRDITWWTGNPGRNTTKFIRVLIRDDLASGGAGPKWAGRRFFTETVAHELGHASLTALGWLYGADFAKVNLCAMFNKPESHWDDPALAWDQRVVEASCEYFKDVCYPNRQYNHRTQLQLPVSQGEDFIYLMFDLIESPYWETGNIDDLHAHENAAFFNLGPASFITNERVAMFYYVNPAIFSDPLFLARSARRNLKWDPAWSSGLPADGSHSLVMRYNFDSEATAADPGEDPTTHVGYRWNSLQGDGSITGDPNDVNPGYPRYAFDPSVPGTPGNRVVWGMRFNLFTLDHTFINLGTSIGEIDFPLYRSPGDAGYVGVAGVNPDTFIPPVKGAFSFDPTQITYDVAWIAAHGAALPEEGFCITASIRGSTGDTQPKFSLYPSEPVGPSDTVEGLSVFWPWVEYVGPRASFLRDIPYPYKTLHGSVTLGPLKNGQAALDYKYVGRLHAAHSLVPRTSTPN